MNKNQKPMKFTKSINEKFLREMIKWVKVLHTHVLTYINIYMYSIYIYIYTCTSKKLQQVKFAYLSYVPSQLHFLVTQVYSSKSAIWEWYYLTKWTRTRLNPQWSCVNSVPNNAMMTTTVHLNHNFKENPVRGRHCDGVRDGFLCCS